MNEKPVNVSEQVGELGACWHCGSTRVQIPVKGKYYLHGDLETGNARVEYEPTPPDFGFGVPQCGKCGALRGDISRDQIEEIWQWACQGAGN